MALHGQDAAAAPWLPRPLLNLAAVLSVSIGLLNLFPVPLLDGGHLMFYGIEAIRGRPLSERAQEVGFRIGFAWQPTARLRQGLEIIAATLRELGA